MKLDFFKHPAHEYDRGILCLLLRTKDAPIKEERIFSFSHRTHRWTQIFPWDWWGSCGTVYMLVGSGFTKNMFTVLLNSETYSTKRGLSFRNIIAA